MGSDGGGLCPNCAKLRLQIIALKAENERLKAQLERARKKIERLKKILRWVIRQLKGVLAFVCHIMRKTDKVLKKKSGISPRRWGWAKGAHWVAERVMLMVGGIIARVEMLMMGE